MSDFLFAQPSALEGIGRMLDIGATMQEYNSSPTTAQADTRALRNDFVAVGEDIRAALGLIQQEVC